MRIIPITIDKSISLEDFVVGGFVFEVSNSKTSEVDALIESLTQMSFGELEEVVNLPRIKQARNGYKKLGKDPSRYRLACEALIRRMIRGMGLYRIGDLVDLGNYLSIVTQRSLCVVDFDKLIEPLSIRLGTSSDVYQAIGRGVLNVENIPLYEDSTGPFGSPTSDTEKTKVTDSTRRILVLMIFFEKNTNHDDIMLIKKIYEKFANGKIIGELLCERKTNE